jgi:nucleoside-diphosphate-sugar epimerase
VTSNIGPLFPGGRLPKGPENLQVVVGAAGSLGSAVVRHLVARGLPVRAVVQDQVSALASLPAAAAVEERDVADRTEAIRACREAAVVYHCASAPYGRWEAFLPVATENLIAGARAAGARMLFPGKVYGYGPLRSLPAGEDHPLAATSRKGRLRNRVEDMLMTAHRAGDVPVIIARYPDFYGPGVTNRLFGTMFEAAVAGGTARWPGSLDAPHDLVYVEDAAASAVLLAGSPDAAGQAWHVPGPGPLTGREFLGLVFEATGGPPRISSFGRMALALFGIAQPDAREMIEMLYQWEAPMTLDGGKFARACPDFRYTPHGDAVAATVAWFRARRMAIRS